MDYVRMGTTGLRVSQICLGMMSYGDPAWRDWVLPYEDALPLVRAAADAGITFFDTADVYSVGVSEELTGRMLRQVFPPVRTTSWPRRCAAQWARGKTTSACPAGTSWTGQCVDMGVGTLPWSPLARGILARPDGDTSTTRSASDTFSPELYGGEQQSAILGVLGTVAEEHGASRATTALAWLLTRPGVTAPIVGVTKPHHLHDAIAAVELQLTPQQIDALETPYRPRPVLGHS
ncbi:hypothetical protein BH23ACT9_BH23ACT9_08990 [soil metagenome]